MITRCVCGHPTSDHSLGWNVCLIERCGCWFFRAEKPTAQGVRAPGGGEALPIQGQSEGTP